MYKKLQPGQLGQQISSLSKTYPDKARKKKEGALQVNELAYQIEVMRDRLCQGAGLCLASLTLTSDRATSLYQNVKQWPLPLQNWLKDLFEEVGTALEGLHLTREGLLRQNEEIAAARQAVNAQRQRYQDLFDFVSDAYLVTDASGTIQEANQAATKLLNISQQSLVGKPLSEFVPLEKRPTFCSQLNQLTLQIGSVQEWQLRLCPHKANPFNAALRVAAFLDRERECISLRWLVRDISPSQQAEQKLRQKQEQLRSLSACSPVGIFLTDIEGRCTYTNSRCQEICDFTLQESWGEGWSGSVHPEDRQRVFAEWSESTCEGREYSDEFRLQTKDGTVRWVHTRSSPMFSEQGDLIGHVGTVEDITERKQLQRKLCCSEQELSNFVNNGPMGLHCVGADGYIVWANQAELELLGYSKEEYIGHHITEFHVDKDVIDDILRRLQANETLHDYEARLLCKDGSIKYVLIDSNVLWKDGKFIHTRCFTRDITARKQTLERLTESENRLRTIIETEPECVKIMAADGTLLEMNPAGVALIEAPSVEAVIGQSVYALIAPEHRERFVAFNERVCQGNRGTLEFEIIGLQGTRRWMETHAVPLRRESDGTLLNLAITRDITDRKQAEEALKQAKQELEIRVEERTAQLRTTNEQLLKEIAERKRAEEELEHSLSLLRGTLEATADGIIVSQNGTHIATCNQKFIEMWGIPESVIASRELNQLVPLILEQVKDCEAFLGTTQELLSEPDAEGYGIYDLKDGRIIERYSLPQRIGGNIVGRVCCFRDITERHRAQKALQEKEAFLHLILDNIPQFIFWKDRNSVYLGCNRNFSLAADQSSPEEIVGKTDYDLPWKKEESDLFRECDARVMATDTPEYHIIEPQLQANGKQAWLDTIKVPLHDAQGNVVGILGTYEDITDRRQAQIELQQSEQKYRNLFHNSLVGIFRNTIADGTVIDANEAVLKMFGFDSCEGVRAVDLYVNPADREILKQQLFERGSVENFETQVRRKDGSVFWVSYSGKLYAKEGYLEGVMIDITERKQAEEALKKAKEELEIRVEERTTELRYAIRLLQDEIEERKRTQEELQRSEARFRELACREALLNRLANQIRKSLALDTILETAVQEIYNRLAVNVCIFAWYANDEISPGWDVVKEAKNSDLPSFLGLYPLESCRPFPCKLVNQDVFQVDNITQSDVFPFDASASRVANGAARLTENATQLHTATENLKTNIGEQQTFPHEVQSVHRAVQEILLPFGTAALLSLPIHTQSGKLGAIICGRLDSWQSWTDEELELLQAVANPLIIGINQAQLYEQSRIAATTAQTKAAELEEAMHELQHTQAQLIQSEKMSSLGQLVAGVAHEINNPLNFIHGNLTHVNQYAKDLLNLIQLYQEYYTNPAREIQAETEAIDLEFIKEDLPKILSSMTMGADRIRQIVLSLRSFSRLDVTERKWSDIHEGLDNTLLILAHRLKDKPHRPSIQIIKEYGDLPLVKCYPGQMNQVFMNILTNAIDALEMGNREWGIGHGESGDEGSQDNSPHSQSLIPTIWIRTEVHECDCSKGTARSDCNGTTKGNRVVIRIADNGSGMTQEVQRKIFDPFFTTKPVGSGTGLGMSISYQIVVDKHGGQLQLISVPGQGTEFFIYIPIEPHPINCFSQAELAEPLTKN